MQYLLSKNEVVNWLLVKGQEDNNEITPKKLQKLLYYVYSWGLVFFNEDSNNLDTYFFDGDFEAWVHGPVDRDTYIEFKEFGRNAIDIRKTTLNSFGEEEEDLLNQVWDAYSSFSANQLEALTHSEEPWKRARGNTSPVEASNKRLEDKEIFNFYGSQLAEG